MLWAASWQNQQSDCAPSEDSDQPGHPPSLIRAFVVRLKKPWALASHWAHSEDSDQTGRMPRLIWVTAGRTATLLILSRGGSYNYLLPDSPCWSQTSTSWGNPSCKLVMLGFDSKSSNIMIIIFRSWSHLRGCSMDKTSMPLWLWKSWNCLLICFSVGKSLYTKNPEYDEDNPNSSKKGLNIVHEYKYPEKSDEERKAALMAHKTARLRRDVYTTKPEEGVRLMITSTSILSSHWIAMLIYNFSIPGPVDRLDAPLSGIQMVAGSILRSGKIFLRGDWLWTHFYSHYFSPLPLTACWFQQGN